MFLRRKDGHDVFWEEEEEGSLTPGVRGEAAGERFHEIYIEADLSTCESRDPKGLYRKARAGEIADFTGISAPYEAPETPELAVATADRSVDDCVQQVTAYVDRIFTLKS